MSGMPWFRLYRDVASHPKVIELEGMVGPPALSYVVRLWCEVATHAMDGVCRYPARVLERWMRWDGEDGRLVGSLCAAGLLEEHPSGFEVVGWAERQEGVIAKFERDRNYADRQKKRVVRTDSARTPQGILATEERRGEESERRSNLSREAVVPLRALLPAQLVAPVTPPARENEKPRDLTKPIWAQRKEPLSMHGEIPTGIGEILAFKWREDDVMGHAKRKAPDLTERQIWEAVEDAMNHRGALTDYELRRWHWPDGCLPKVMNWLERANIQHLKAQREREYAAKAGIYTPRKPR